jgi:hypothetical protein
MMTYFATDGSYGDGEDILVLDTWEWTDEMWDFIGDEARDGERVYVAELFDLGATVDEVRGICENNNSNPDKFLLYAPIDLANYREANNAKD